MKHKNKLCTTIFLLYVIFSLTLIIIFTTVRIYLTTSKCVTLIKRGVSDMSEGESPVEPPQTCGILMFQLFIYYLFLLLLLLFNNFEIDLEVSAS